MSVSRRKMRKVQILSKFRKDKYNRFTDIYIYVVIWWRIKL